MSNIQKGWKYFLILCQENKEMKNLSDLFDLFFTAEEKESIATRYLIVHELLKKEKTQREIAKSLNVSIAKITRGSNELKRQSPIFLNKLQVLLNQIK